MKEVEFDKLIKVFENLSINDVMPNGCESVSVSNVNNLIKEAFDGEGVAENLVNKYFNDEGSKWYGLSKEDILNQWSEKANTSIKYGKLLDEYADLRLNNSDTALFELDNDVDDDERLKCHMNAFDDFINEHIIGRCEYIGREIPVCLKIDEKSFINGRLDALFYDKRRNKIVICDWKSNEEIETDATKFTKDLLGSAKSLKELSWNLYTIQLQFYKFALLQNWFTDLTPNDIEVYIVNCPHIPYVNKHSLSNGSRYSIFPEAFPYDEAFLTKIFTYALKKNKLLKSTKK